LVNTLKRANHPVWQRKVDLRLALGDCFCKLFSLRLEKSLDNRGLSGEQALLSLVFFCQAI
jgi:hypothetical protein